MAIKEKEYWDGWYQKFGLSSPSPFAVFCESLFFPPHGHVIDAGCGNGRDTLYFQEKGYHVEAIDASGEGRGIRHFFREDACRFVYDCDIVYSRWFLHALDEASENDFLLSIGKSRNRIVCFECRSAKDDDPPVGDHYRRPIHKGELEKKITSYGFSLLYSGEKRGWSKTEDSDPLLIRIIAKRPLT